MATDTKQSKAVTDELVRLKAFFDTTPILIKEWKTSYFVVRDIPLFLEAQFKAASAFSSKADFNPPLSRLLEFEKAVRNQLTSISE